MGTDPVGSAKNKESFLIRGHRKESEAKLNSSIRKQKGVTLVELLVVVAVLAIMGGVTGAFLIKYLPEYHLRSAANNLSQDLKFAQVNALKRLETWSVNFTAGSTHTYTITRQPASTIVKTVDLKSLPHEIRFKTVPGSPVQFNAEGFKVGTANATIELQNSQGSVITTTIARTGSVRVTR